MQTAQLLSTQLQAELWTLHLSSSHHIRARDTLDSTLSVSCAKIATRGNKNGLTARVFGMQYLEIYMCVACRKSCANA